MPTWLIALCLFTGSGYSQNAGGISDGVQEQIAQILAIKRTFNQEEQKMSSELAFASRMARGLPVGVAANLIDPKLLGGEVKVQIQMRSRKANQAKALAAKGKVIGTEGGIDHIQATVAATELSKIAADPNVLSIREPEPYQTCAAPPIVSQGYLTHKAKAVVENLGVTGSGVKVGVLADNAAAASVTALITSGDLGANTTVLPGQNGTGTNEGAAMMEVIQDIAPGAQIYFATGTGGQANMANNIAALAAAGCTIIVDDFSYVAEPAFQDGPIAKAINTFVAGGGLYFASAGNNGNLTSSTSGVWEGDFLDGGNVSGPIATAGETGKFHNFGTAGSPQNYVLLSTAGAGTNFTLKWSDPVGGSTNDYDIFLLNSTGTTLKAFSAGVQNGTQDPVEVMTTSGAAANDRIVVVLFSGAQRAIRVDAHKNRLSISTAGTTFGHNAAASVLTVGATSWNSAKAGTKAFDGTNNPVENYSADGPRKMFYNANGTAVISGNLLFGTNGGTTLQKPDFTAADNVVVTTSGFIPFSGTSAAAAHAAGVAALVKSAKPTLTNTDITTILRNTALDNMSAGVDRDGGYGVIDAKAAVLAAQQ